MIALSPATRSVVAAAIRAAAGREICGLVLAGPSGAQRFLQLTSVSEASTTFSVSSGELARARRFAAREGWRIVALLHSHVTTLEPSDADRRSAARSAWPWLIVRNTAGALEIAELGAATGRSEPDR